MIASDKKILYVGPSWAHRSFDTPGGDEKNYTNLYREIGLEVVDLSQAGTGNFEMLDSIKRYPNDYDGIIWVFAEPLNDPTWTKSSLEELIESENFWSIRQNIYNRTLERIASEIKKPVALIGAHSDVVDQGYTQINVIHDSWQKYLAQAVGVNLNVGWGADVLHRMITLELPQAKPSVAVVDAVSDQFKFWKQMELRKVFSYVHPTTLGNKIFAEEISPKIYQWSNQL